MGAIVAVLSLLLSTVQTYADDLTCQTLNTGCVAATPTLDAPGDGSYNLLSGLTLSWTDDQDPSFTVCVSHTQDMSAASCETTGQKSIPATDLIKDDGTWYWQVTAIAGGLLPQDTASAVRSLIVDTPPTVSLLVNQSTNPVDVGNGANVDVHGQATDASATSCSITIAGPSAAGPFDCTSTNDFQWSTAGLESGTYTITISASDPTMDAHGVSPITDSVAINVDNSGPSLAVGNDGVLLPQGSIDPELTADDPHGPITYAWSDGSTNPAVLSYDHSAMNPTFTPTVSGDYVYTVIATDSFGNQSSKAFHFTYWPDVPLVPLPTDTDVTPTADIQPATTTVVTGGTAGVMTTTSRRGDDDESAPTASTLGASTITKVVAADTTDKAPILATHQGWQILGVLWYWWLTIVTASIAAIWWVVTAIRTRNTQQS